MIIIQVQTQFIRLFVDCSFYCSCCSLIMTTEWLKLMVWQRQTHREKTCPQLNLAVLSVYFSHLSRASPGIQHLCSHCLCYFHSAAITKYHKFGWLKQPKFIIMQFYSLEVWHESHQTKIKFLARLCSSWRLQRRIHPLPFPASAGYLIPRCVVSSTFKPSNSRPTSSPITSLWHWLSSACSSTFRNSCYYTGPTQIIQDIS